MKWTRLEGLVREFAETRGVRGKTGGWIYDTESDEPICQGWTTFYQRFRHVFRDWLAEEVIGAPFSSILYPRGTYRPTIRERTKKHEALADEYDAVMRALDDERRAYRGQSAGERYLCSAQVS